MSVNAGSCKIVKFEPCTEVNEHLQEFAESFFEVVTNDYTDEGLEQLVGYMRQDAKESTMRVSAESFGVELPPYTVELLSSDDWLADNVIEFAPVEVAEFMVYGIHEKNVDTKGRIGIKVYAATAFGSEHQTTKCCLMGLSDIHKLINFTPKVLDVGTGSGILSLAAAKLWPQSKIIAVDIDDESVAVTKQNAVDNGVEKQIMAVYSDGYQSAGVRNNAPYDIILANILARPLIAMAENMSKHLQTGGYAVISGFIEDQVDWVVEAHEKYGLHLEKVYEVDNWRAALLKKVK